jgi:hypothetical protein
LGWRLRHGYVYSMIVTDEYGLRRYQTNDLFKCERKIGDLCDLRFLRRKGIQYSFTGEKLTGEQLVMGHEILKKEIKQTVHMTLIPSLKLQRNIPGYYLVIAPPKVDDSIIEMKDYYQKRFIEILSDINDEFKSKIESNRLDLEVRIMDYSTLASVMDSKTVSESDIKLGAWESQFKLMPLYTKHWEEYGLK